MQLGSYPIAVCVLVCAQLCGWQPGPGMTAKPLPWLLAYLSVAAESFPLSCLRQAGSVRDPGAGAAAVSELAAGAVKLGSQGTGHNVMAAWLAPLSALP